MVNASLNWASICGLVLLLWTPLMALAGVEMFSRKGKTKSLLILIIGRYFFGLICAGILFFQGWRLDPILQFGVFLLVLGLVAESIYGMSRDGFSLHSDRKRYKSVYESAKTNKTSVPQKTIILWYFLALAGAFVPILGGSIVLLFAWNRFSKVEERLLELQQSL